MVRTKGAIITSTPKYVLSVCVLYCIFFVFQVRHLELFLLNATKIRIKVFQEQTCHISLNTLKPDPKVQVFKEGTEVLDILLDALRADRNYPLFTMLFIVPLQVRRFLGSLQSRLEMRLAG